MTIHRKMAMRGAPPHIVEYAAGRGRPKRGRFITCAECRQGGGTLLKRNDGTYVHSVCPGLPAVLHQSTGLVLPPTKLWAARRKIPK